MIKNKLVFCSVLYAVGIVLQRYIALSGLMMGAGVLFLIAALFMIIKKKPQTIESGLEMDTFIGEDFCRQMVLKIRRNAYAFQGFDVPHGGKKTVKKGIHLKSDCYIYLVLIACFAVGAIYGNYVSDVSNKKSYKFLDKKVELTGRIIDVAAAEGYDRYVIKAISISYLDTNIKVNDKIDVTLYTKEGDSPYQYGDIISIRSNLSLMSAQQNDGEMDYAMWRATKGVFFSMAGEYKATAKLANTIQWWNIFDIGYKTREFAANTVDKYMDGDYAAVTKGILISDKSDISPQVYADLQVSGVIHIATASGMHVSSLLVLIFALLFALRLRRNQVYLACLPLLAFFAIVQGCTPSIIRAVIMAVLFMAADALGRDEDKRISLAVSVMLILIFNPLSLFDISFQLSFASMFGIVVLAPVIRGLLEKRIKVLWLREGIAVTTGVQICVIPIIAYYFNQIAVYVLVANLLISPVIILVLAAGLLLVVFNWIFNIAFPLVPGFLAMVVGYILEVVRFIARLPYSVITVASPTVWDMSIYSGIVLAAYLWIKKKSHRYIAAILSVCMCIVILQGVVYWINKDVMEVTFVNVGQGDGTIVKMPNSMVAIIDGGGSPSYSSSNIGKNVFVPYLVRRGIRTIDFAIVTCYDNPHAQGVIAAVEMLDVKVLVLPERNHAEKHDNKDKLETLAKQKGIPIYYAMSGKKISFGNDISMDIISPTQTAANNFRYSDTQKSVVFKLSYGTTDFLFAGDIEQGIENDIISRSTALDAEVLKVANHGLDTSSSQAFVQAVSPKIAMISVKEDDEKGYTGEETLNLLQDQGIKIYRTDLNGDTTFRVLKNRIIEVKTFR